MVEDEKTSVNVMDDFLRIHETGLQGFVDTVEAKIAETGKPRKEVKVGFYGTNTGDALEGYVAEHLDILDMHTDNDRNLLHVLADLVRDGVYRVVRRAVSIKPELMEERETTFGFTPAFSMMVNGKAHNLGTALEAIEPNAKSFAPDSEATAAEKFPKRTAILSQRAMMGDEDTGLVFWLAGHSGSPGLNLLKSYDIDRWENIEKDGEKAGLPVKGKQNVFKVACSKYMLNGNDGSSQGLFLNHLISEYTAKFGPEKLIELIESDFPTYALLAGAGFHCPIYDKPEPEGECTHTNLMPAERIVALLNGLDVGDKQIAKITTRMFQVANFNIPKSQELYEALLDKEKMGKKCPDPNEIFGEQGLDPLKEHRDWSADKDCTIASMAREEKMPNLLAALDEYFTTEIAKPVEVDGHEAREAMRAEQKLVKGVLAEIHGKSPV